jgi:cation diffusion facilitator family transporter
LKSGRRLGSYILISDSMHTRSDIFVSIGVLVSLVGIKLGLPPVVDPIVSLVVAGFILFAAYEILKSASNVLVDKAVVETDRIRAIVETFEQVKGIHEIRSRGTGDSLFIDMHILTDPGMSVKESHELIHHIEKHIQEQIAKGASVIVHLEPFGDDNDPDV